MRSGPNGPTLVRPLATQSRQGDGSDIFDMNPRPTYYDPYISWEHEFQGTYRRTLDELVEETLRSDFPAVAPPPLPPAQGWVDGMRLRTTPRRREPYGFTMDGPIYAEINPAGEIPLSPPQNPIVTSETS